MCSEEIYRVVLERSSNWLIDSNNKELAELAYSKGKILLCDLSKILLGRPPLLGACSAHLEIRIDH